MNFLEMRKVALTCGAVIIASPMSAETGFYYGLSAGVSMYDTVALGNLGPADSTGLTFGGIVGYTFETNTEYSTAIEVSVDGAMADTLESTEGYGPACGDYSPHWCEIDTVVRLRSLVKRRVNEDWSIVGSLGGVMVNGLLENGPGTYVSGRGLGYSVGLGAEKQVAKGTMRIEAIYDVITTDNRPMYDRDLDILSLRASFIF